MNNRITKIKNTLEGINRRITEAKEWITEVKDRIVEITAKEQNKEKRKELWKISETSRIILKEKIQIIGVAEEEDKKGLRKLLKRL